MTNQKKYYIANVCIQASTDENPLTFLENYITDSKDVSFYFTIDNIEVSFIDFKDFDNSLLKQTVELELATIVQLNITGGVEINGYATEEEISVNTFYTSQFVAKKF